MTDAFGDRIAPSAPLVLNSPVKGAGMPPKVSHGLPAASALSDAFAWSTLTGVGPLPPSMNTSPERPSAPALPLKSQVA